MTLRWLKNPNVLPVVFLSPFLSLFLIRILYISFFVSLFLPVCLSVCSCLSVCLSVYHSRSLFLVCVCVFMCVRVCAGARVRVCVYMCICIYTHRWENKLDTRLDWQGLHECMHVCTMAWSCVVPPLLSVCMCVVGVHSVVWESACMFTHMCNLLLENSTYFKTQKLYFLTPSFEP